MIIAPRHYLARVRCALTGHIRGKRLSVANGIVTFSCPRCASTWTRKLPKGRA